MASGHLREPYPEERAPASIPAPVVSRKDLGVARWQHDLWYRIVTAALEGHPAQVDLADIEGLDAPGGLTLRGDDAGAAPLV